MGVRISLATTKGGAGKSTLTALLAGEFAHAGQPVTIIDADPQQTLFKWAERCQQAGTVAPDITVLACGDEARFQSAMEVDAPGITLIDVQGAASQILTVAMLASDLVVVPCIPSEFDAAEATKIPKFLKATAMRGRAPTPYRLVLNSVDGIEARTNVFRRVVTNLMDQNVEIAQTIVLKRTTYRQIAGGVGSLYLIEPKTDAVMKAIADIRALAHELTGILSKFERSGGMTSDGDDKDFSSRLAGLSAKRQRLDLNALKRASDAGKATLLDAGVAGEIAVSGSSGKEGRVGIDDCLALQGKLEPAATTAIPHGNAKQRQSPDTRHVSGADIDPEKAAVQKTTIALPADIHLALKLHVTRTGSSIKDYVTALIAEKARNGF